MTSLNKKIVNPTSEEDKKLFKERIEHWKVKLGLQDWRVYVPTGHSPGACADCLVDYPARMARIRFGQSFGGDAVTPESIDATALHELLHVFLYDLIETCHDKPNPDRLQTQEHKVINMLEALLIKKSSDQT